jgi:hypothetical protein
MGRASSVIMAVAAKIIATVPNSLVATLVLLCFLALIPDAIIVLKKLEKVLHLLTNFDENTRRQWRDYH